MPIRPPGLSTRAISVSTAGLSIERLITQFEMTTSTESAGSGICSITPLRKCTFATPASAAFCRASASISSVMSRPYATPGRADALRREDHVDPAARAEVEHRLALSQVGDSGRVAATERGERRGLGELAALLGVVERLAELRRVALAVGAARAAAATAAVLPSVTARADSA